MKYFTLVILLIISLQATDFEDGMDAFDNQNYNLAFKLMKKVVDNSGYKYAKSYLATMYLSGKGTKPNYKKAFKLAKSAAEQGSTMSFYTLGVIYSNGAGIKKNNKKAVEYFEKYLDKTKDGKIALWVAQTYKSANGVKQNYKKALTYFKIANQKLNTAETQFYIGFMYNELDNKILAYKWYYEASKNGHMGATILIKELCTKNAWACK